MELSESIIDCLQNLAKNQFLNAFKFAQIFLSLNIRDLLSILLLPGVFCRLVRQLFIHAD